MTIDPTIREQTYPYFVQEAPELLQSLEQGLLSLRTGFSLNKVNSLMRATHTLKGAATSVGAETIATIAHALEDIFKALCQPEASIDPEIEALLFEGYECLSLALAAELSDRSIGTAEILDRAATVFAQLQERLGDWLTQESHLPTSVELGFDVTQSMFENGVTQRLEQITNAINEPQSDLITVLRTQSEVFFGLAESLNLPGFGRIAQAVLTAIDRHPEQISTIAQLALADFREGRAAVLRGDRSQGGQPSQKLQQLAGWSADRQEFPFLETVDTATLNPVVTVEHTAASQANEAHPLRKTETVRQEAQELPGKSTPAEPRGLLKIWGWIRDFVQLDPEDDRSLSGDSIYQSSGAGNSGAGKSTTVNQGAVNQVTANQATANQVTFNDTPFNNASFNTTVNTTPFNSTAINTGEDNTGDQRPEHQGLNDSTAQLLEHVWGNYVESDDPIALDLDADADSLEERTTYPYSNHLIQNRAARLTQHRSGQTDVSFSIVTHAAQPSSASSLSGSPIQRSDASETVIEAFLLQDQNPATASLIPQEKYVAQTSVVRVNVESLKDLSYSIGELMTNQSHQLLQNEQLRLEVRTLLKRLQSHQNQLYQLHDRPFSSGQSLQPSSGQWPPKSRGLSAVDLEAAFPYRSHFDTLELDRYSEAELLVQSLIDDTIQLAETAEALDFFSRQASQALEQQGLLLTHVREALMEARMLPLGEILTRFSTVLQQLEALYGKPVDLKLRGTEVLVDKVVAEKLYEPLLHLIRNAFDHGIESTATRQQRGKPQNGQLEICAYHQGRYLMIEVRDDGRGLDFEKIRQRAVEYQLVSPAQVANLSLSQLTDLLFEPGFSTTEQVNALSGRGIGLDVVRNQLRGLQASIAVTSELHRGTTFTLKIPVDFTVAKLLLCQVNQQSYALLTDAIEQVFAPQPEQILQRERGKLLRWRRESDEQLVPLYSLTTLLKHRSWENASEIQTGSSLPNSQSVQTEQPCVILVRCDKTWVGLELDHVIGEQELVVRPLGAAIEPPGYVHGASTTAKGQLTLVLDIVQLIQQKVIQQNVMQPEVVPHQTLELQRSLEQKNRDIEPLQRLPLSLPAQIQTSQRGSASPADIRQPSSQSLLVVEDSITTRQTLVLTLQRAGYSVRQAKDGYEAIEQLQPPNVQLVICDLEMPRMNGFEFLSYRQRVPALSQIPVIVLTSRSSEKHRLLASQLGATAYLTKPYIERKLLEIVASLLETGVQNLS